MQKCISVIKHYISAKGSIECKHNGQLYAYGSIVQASIKNAPLSAIKMHYLSKCQ